MTRALVATIEHHIAINAHLPRRIVKNLHASALEFSLYVLVGIGHWIIVVRGLLKLLRTNFARGLRVALISIPRSEMKRLVFVALKRKTKPIHNPFFSI
jgi:hypothetical protein